VQHGSRRISAALLSDPKKQAAHSMNALSGKAALYADPTWAMAELDKILQLFVPDLTPSYFRIAAAVAY
jgi:hypothetical protein